MADDGGCACMVVVVPVALGAALVVVGTIRGAGRGRSVIGTGDGSVFGLSTTSWVLKSSTSKAAPLIVCVVMVGSAGNPVGLFDDGRSSVVIIFRCRYGVDVIIGGVGTTSEGSRCCCC